MQAFRRLFAVLGALLCVNTSVAALDARISQIVTEELIPAFQSGHIRGVLETASGITRRIDERQLQELNDLLQKQGIPSVGDLLVDARLTLVTQQVGNLPRPSAHELQIAVPALSAKISAELDRIQKSPVMSSSLPTATSFEQFEERLWDLHVISNQLRNSTVLVDYGSNLLRDQKRRGRRGAAIPSSSDAADFESLGQRITQLEQTHDERQLAERLERLQFALRVLTDSEDHKQRFYAAFVGDLDGRLLIEWLGKQDKSKVQGDLLQTVKDRHEAIVNAAGRDLLQKSQALFVGLHWWLRGRYGMGPDGHGMLKDATALRSPEAMFGLFMPIETPKPTAPDISNTARVPEIDRRHHYIWMFPYQKIGVVAQTRTDSTTSQTGTRTVLERFY